MQKNKEIIYDEIRKIAIILGESLTEERIKLYVEILSKYDFEKIIRAIKSCATSCKFFPKPSEIIEQVTLRATSIDADYLAGEIIKSVTEFGYMAGENAMNQLGPIAWEAVNKAGGWLRICESPANELSQLRAQLRGMCLVSLNSGEVKNRISFFEERENKLKSLSGNFKKLLE